MTVPLSPGSSRHSAAVAFGAELRRAMTARKASSKRLALAAHVTLSGIGNFKSGLNLPRLETAERLAIALDWPRLAAIAREARTAPCVRCGREFVNPGGKPKRFCSVECREVDAQLRAPTAGAELAASLRAALAGREGMKGGLPKAVVSDALDAYARSDAKRRARVDQQGRALERVRAAVEAMCRACEPDGVCRDEPCPLRSVSPLPFIPVRDVAAPRPPEGAHGPTFRATTLAAIRAAAARRWTPEERERMGAIQRARFEGMSADERAAHRRRVSEGRRKSA